MKAMRFVLVILTSTAVAAFYAVPSAPSRHHAATSRTRFSLRADRIASRTTAVRMSVSTGSQELPRLPPGDDSKGGDAQSGESTTEIGHVMSDRKLTLSFTCNICEDRSTYKINRVSFMHGIVVLWCQSCNQKHLIADNLGKLDFPEFGRNLEEYMAKQGTPVRRVVMSKEGISHVEVEVPGADYPERQPRRLTEKDFDGTNLLPGAHVGDSGIMPGMPGMDFGGIGAGEEYASGDEGVGGLDSDA